MQRGGVQSLPYKESSPALSDAAALASRVPAASDPQGLSLLTVQDLLLALYLYPFRCVATYSPRWFLYGASKLSDPMLQFIWRDRRQRALNRIMNTGSLGIPQQRAREISRRYISNAGFCNMDDLILSRTFSHQSLRCESIDGLEHLEDAKAAGSGVIILSAHFFANRLAKRYLAAIGYPMLSIRSGQFSSQMVTGRLGRRFLEPRYREFLHSIMPDEVFVQDPECTLKILERLRSGGLVNVQFDAAGGPRTVKWPFLGGLRSFAMGPFHLVRLSKCAVVPMLCLGRGDGFRISFGPPIEIRSAKTREEFVQLNIAAFVEPIEQQIVGHPEEWEGLAWG